MRQEPSEREIVERVGKVLGESSDDLDLRTQSRLLAIRREAIERMSAPRERRFSIPRWASASAFVTALVAVAIALVVLSGPNRHRQQVSKLDDLEIMVSGENLELYEDLEFYQWLESRNHNG
ncbi:MAG: DUF3619 family protein [Geobacter sp.]|nr:DUF3619 family protein [Geobacter sp.]